MNKRLDNAKNLYLEGIMKGNYKEAIYKYTGDRYTQHSTFVKDGQVGFIEFFEDFVKRNPIREIEIIRGFEDGKYIFLQAFQKLNNGEYKYVTTDFFDTDDNGKIIEHWDVITEYYEPNKNGTDAINGSTVIRDLKDTESNKDMIHRLMNDLIHGNYNELDVYFKENVISHRKNAVNTLTDLKEYLSNQVYETCFLLVGQGNFVSTLSRVYDHDVEMCQTDIFRLDDGKIVEHWINKEVVLPEATDYNIGKF